MTRLAARLGRWAGYAGEFLIYLLLRPLPIALISAIGAHAIAPLIRLGAPEVAARAATNLRRLRPDLTEAEREAIVQRHIVNLGRTMAEYSCIDRLSAAGRVESVERDRVKTMLESEPIMGIVLHTGHFEVPGEALREMGVRWSTFYWPPESPMRLWLAKRTRARLGVTLLHPSARGMLDALHALDAGSCVSIYGDEYRPGRMMAPLFGRPPHDKGNLALAIRLARRTGARIVIAYCTRLEGARFRTQSIGPITLPPETRRDARILEDVAFLNGLIEPVIRAHLDQWYFLDNPIGGDEPIGAKAA